MSWIDGILTTVGSIYLVLTKGITTTEHDNRLPVDAQATMLECLHQVVASVSGKDSYGAGGHNVSALQWD